MTKTRRTFTDGKQHYLWRAVDQHGTVLDILVQSRRNTKAAKRFSSRSCSRGRSTFPVSS